jgi:hypothetical protein
MLKCGFFVLGTESDCTIGYVKCGNQVDCIYAELICDGTQQYPDGSDEDKEIYTQGKYCVIIQEEENKYFTEMFLLAMNERVLSDIVIVMGINARNSRFIC